MHPAPIGMWRMTTPSIVFGHERLAAAPDDAMFVWRCLRMIGSGRRIFWHVRFPPGLVAVGFWLRSLSVREAAA